MVPNEFARYSKRTEVKSINTSYTQLFIWFCITKTSARRTMLWSKRGDTCRASLSGRILNKTAVRQQKHHPHQAKILKLKKWLEVEILIWFNAFYTLCLPFLIVSPSTLFLLFIRFFLTLVLSFLFHSKRQQTGCLSFLSGSVCLGMRHQGSVALICPWKELYRDFVRVWEMSLWFLLKGMFYKHSHQRRQNTKFWQGLSRKSSILKRWFLNKRNSLLSGSKLFYGDVFHQRHSQQRTVSNLLLRRAHGDAWEVLF